jgi:hypothetical protein
MKRRSRKAANNSPPLPPEAEEAFIRGIVERSEAAVPDKDGQLPPQATHEIIGQRPDGLPLLRERKKSLFGR